ncbi:hypothetical protein BDN71DRAFT_1162437 [Pleurotus eryngii]|uniref:Uncharacterized protein n=1 Tax=Pleurotus eryngii TaxID=5323 RepID=A0A9P5ZUN2_PLEER|nr:hypothetical protein BDN71DRAFT_1162437 [Pleurotus eryngii]
MTSCITSAFKPRLDSRLLRQRSMNVIIDMDIGYAIDVGENKDPYVAIAEKALAGLNKASFHGAFLVEVMPILKYIPAWISGAGF